MRDEYGLGKPAPRVTLNVPFDEKDDARQLGAQWDAVSRTWFCYRRQIESTPALGRWASGSVKSRAAEADAWLRKHGHKLEAAC